MERIAICAALRWECQPVLRQLHAVTKQRLGDFALWHGRAGTREVWLMKTGMGPQRARQAAQTILGAAAFDGLFNTGCAGGLAPDLRPGDLVIATTVIDYDTGRRYETDGATRTSWQAIATAAGIRSLLAPALCSGRMLTSVADKGTAAQATSAVAIDMESAMIAASAYEAGIPFGSVRAILDTAADDVQASFGFINPTTGGIKPLALASHLARHPGMLPQLFTMQRQMAAAQTSLNQFFAAWSK